ncbi:MAG: FAD-dependent oxidoreductase [Gammaproteobacteria bacterium]|nr:FAD-dependent oxidoreductase [Gammaproteobacteria bacterium]
MKTLTDINTKRGTRDELVPGIEGYSYADLYRPEKLASLNRLFHEELDREHPDLAGKFRHYADGGALSATEVSDLLVEMAPHVGEFVARLFNVEDVRQRQADRVHAEINSIFIYKNEVAARVTARFKKENPENWDAEALHRQLLLLVDTLIPGADLTADPEQAVARLGALLAPLGSHYQALAKGKDSDIRDASIQVDRITACLSGHATAKNVFGDLLEMDDRNEIIAGLLLVVQRWTFLAMQGRIRDFDTSGWVSFKFPQKRDFNHLVHHDIKPREGFETWVAPEDGRRLRDGFSLTDPRFNERQVLNEVDHCIYCHERDTDSCSKGMRNKRGGDYKSNPLGSVIIGCPLEEKISEMHVVKRGGDNIGALALIVIDNPMCPGTGHRICNDCMRGCIYQKTEPVNIPQIETNVLTDVLFMPWGFEIYSFLTRWNPLNIKRPWALPYNGKNTLVVGLGPAGYTLSHYLVNEGFGVAGIDALKLEPLPEALVGSDTVAPRPVRNFSELYEDLDERLLAGFGGVAEYGITVRWDKNFLKVIYLNLARRRTFRCYGGVRFGGTITIEDAWKLGFDHIAIASGAGKPTIIGLKNNLIRGIRKASDFLMALQLTGAAKHSSLANLQVRLPIGVIGGGLTAIDTTTEVMAYYPVQVEKILRRYTELVEAYGEAYVRSHYDQEELEILDEFLEHGRAIQAERQRARAANETPNFQKLIDAWGGVTMFYRKGIKDSPAYRQNHEEIHEALQEGIQLAEGMSPVEAIEDEHGALKAVRFDILEEKEGRWVSEGKSLEVPLRSLFIAAGTAPNTIYEQEFPYSFRMDAKFFQRYEPHWNADDLPELVPMNDTAIPKIGKPAPMTSYHKDGRYISFYGDNHPVYAGNVVKAMASARDGYPYIVRLFEKDLKNLDPADQDTRDLALKDLFATLDEELVATVVEINRLTPTIIEVIVKAPAQARKFHPGQFYRVQNLEAQAPRVRDTVLAAEGLALTGAWVDKDQGLISLIALEMGSSSRLCKLWQPGDPLVVMGVTGTPTEITEEKTVMLVGGGLGNAVQFSIGKALRAHGNKVIYFAGYRHPGDVFKTEDIEAASDVIVWAVDPAPGVKPIQTTRPQDKSVVGNIIEAIEAYGRGDLGETSIALSEVDHMIVIGSDRMMAAVKEARYGRLKPYLNPDHAAIGSINSPMQCMMKGVCAQCLCKHIDPHTQEEYFVYSCYNQDQELDRVDFSNLNARLRQNTVQEKLSSLWLDHLLENGEPPEQLSRESG